MRVWLNSMLKGAVNALFSVRVRLLTDLETERWIWSPNKLVIFTEILMLEGQLTFTVVFCLTLAITWFDHTCLLDNVHTFLCCEQNYWVNTSGVSRSSLFCVPHNSPKNSNLLLIGNKRLPPCRGKFLPRHGIISPAPWLLVGASPGQH